MEERLSWDEIKKRYPNEWVCLIDEDAPDMAYIASGIVYAHDPSHDKLLEKQKHLSFASIRWTGKRGRNRVLDDVGGKI